MPNSTISHTGLSMLPLISEGGAYGMEMVMYFFFSMIWACKSHIDASSTTTGYKNIFFIQVWLTSTPLRFPRTHFRATGNLFGGHGCHYGDWMRFLIDKKPYVFKLNLGDAPSGLSRMNWITLFLMRMSKYLIWNPFILKYEAGPASEKSQLFTIFD